VADINQKLPYHSIDADETGRPYVKLERLRQRRKGQKHGWPFSFLLLNEGKGVVWKGEESGKQIDESKDQLDLFQLMKKFESENIGDLGEKILWALANYHEMEKLSLDAYRYVFQNFSWETIVNQYENCYNDI